MGSLALSVTPATPFWRTGKHGINLCHLGRAIKDEMHPKDILSTSQCLPQSLFFSNPYWPLETHIRRLLHTALPHLLSPPHTTLRTTICPPPQSACGQTQNNNVILPLKGTQAAFASSSFNSKLSYYIYVSFITLTFSRMNEKRAHMHSSPPHDCYLCYICVGIQIRIDLCYAVNK